MEELRENLSKIQALNLAEIDVLRMSIRQVAGFAGAHRPNSVVTTPQLQSIFTTIKALNSRLSELDDRQSELPTFEFSKEECIKETLEWQHFGRYILNYIYIFRCSPIIFRLEL